jgi:hypothetical protein
MRPLSIRPKPRLGSFPRVYGAAEHEQALTQLDHYGPLYAVRSPNQTKFFMIFAIP